MAKRGHGWRFFRAGGVDQVVLESGEDLARLGELDQRLWVALACPTKGLSVEEKTLAAIDQDGDGRVRAPEVLAAIDWCGKVFKSLDPFFSKGSSLTLSELDGSTAEGKGVLTSARRMLGDLKKKDAKHIGLDDIEAMTEVFVSARLNGDGVVPADTAEEESLQKAIEEIIAAVGSVPDRSGKPGLDKELLERFVADAKALLDWDDKKSAEGVLALDDGTLSAATALDAVEGKLRDYFTRCRLAKFDERAALALNPTEGELGALSPKTLAGDDDDVARLPLARVEADRALPLEDGINPAWSARVAAFVESAVVPVLGKRARLTEADLAEIVTRLAPCRAWLADKPSGAVAEMGVLRVRELVDAGTEDAVTTLIGQDAELEADYAQIVEVERAVRLRRDLVTIVRNFVSFADFYGRKGATFQAGTLYLDGRTCDLTLRVNDPARHATLAGLSHAYLAYCDCHRGEERMGIVAAFTAGDVDHLMVGRNGVLYDRDHRDWDATITSIINNPLSVRQAFWSPYKRLLRLVEEQATKRAAEKEKASTAKIDAAAATAASADKTAVPVAAGAAAPGTPPGAPGSPASAGKGVDVGTVAAIGVAVAGLATFLSSILATFLGLGIWIPVGLLALLLAISGPSMVIAWLKLRQRNLGPILDANGWAINGRARINVPFGASLTQLAKLPAGASRTAQDPFADKRRPWWLYLLLLLVVALGVTWALGKVDRFLPDSVKASRVLYPSAAPTPAPATAAATAAPAPAAPAPPPAAPAK